MIWEPSYTRLSDLLANASVKQHLQVGTGDCKGNEMRKLVRELLRAVEDMSLREREILLSDLNRWILAGRRRQFQIVRSGGNLSIRLSRNHHA